MRLPEDFVKKIKGLTGFESEADTFFDALTAKSKLNGLRCNPLKITPDKLVKLLDMPLSKVNWCPTGFTYDLDFAEQANRPSKNPLYMAGLYYLQEPSAMAPVEILAPEPGDRVLDLCAAPGGKSVQIAGRLQGKGILVSNDVSATRSRALVKNLTLCGARNFIVTTEQPQKLAKKFDGYFDKILVDAPCSGEGMFRRDSDAVKAWTVNKPEACMAMQREILRYAATMLKPGGRLLYSTCTFDPGENEGTISEFLDANHDFKVVSIDGADRMGFASGHPDWVANGNDGLVKAARLWPHRLDGEGHFLCLLEKDDAARVFNDVSAGHLKGGDKRIQRLPRLLFEDFCQSYLNGALFDPNDSSLVQFKDSLFLIPADLPDMSGLRLARGGWYLGDVAVSSATSRFKPSHAFALGLRDARLVYDFASPEDDNCARYLRGESLEVGGDLGTEKAWVLMCVCGYPIGWAYLVNGRLKNKYPKGWM